MKNKLFKNGRKTPLISINRNLITFLVKLSKQKRAKFIALLKKAQINTISEIFANFLKKRLTSDKKVIKKVSPYKAEIKKVAYKKTPLKEKLKVLVSNRGGNILALLLPLAVQLLTNIFNK